MMKPSYPIYCQVTYNEDDYHEGEFKNKEDTQFGWIIEYDQNQQCFVVLCEDGRFGYFELFRVIVPKELR